MIVKEVKLTDYIDLLSVQDDSCLREAEEAVLYVFDDDIDISAIHILPPLGYLFYGFCESWFERSHLEWVDRFRNGKEVLKIDRVLKRKGYSLKCYGKDALGLSRTVHGPSEYYLRKREYHLAASFFFEKNLSDSMLEMLARTESLRKRWTFRECLIDEMRARINCIREVIYNQSLMINYLYFGRVDVDSISERAMEKGARDSYNQIMVDSSCFLYRVIDCLSGDCSDKKRFSLTYPVVERLPICFSGYWSFAEKEIVDRFNIASIDFFETINFPLFDEKFFFIDPSRELEDIFGRLLNLYKNDDPRGVLERLYGYKKIALERCPWLSTAV